MLRYKPPMQYMREGREPAAGFAAGLRSVVPSAEAPLRHVSPLPGLPDLLPAVPENGWCWPKSPATRAGCTQRTTAPAARGPQPDRCTAATPTAALPLLPLLISDR